MNDIEKRIRESIEVKERIIESEEVIDNIQKTVDYFDESLKNGGKIILCGNGGSASDAMHIAGELVGRFQVERQGMAAIALNGDVTSVTSIANDYGYENVFARMTEALMKRQDTLVGISTSGNSKNVYNALVKAKELGCRTVAFLGRDGGIIKEVADVSIVVPSGCTARIQEAHIMIGHIVCEMVELRNAN